MNRNRYDQIQEGLDAITRRKPKVVQTQAQAVKKSLACVNYLCDHGFRPVHLESGTFYDGSTFAIVRVTQLGATPKDSWVVTAVVTRSELAIKTYREIFKKELAAPKKPVKKGVRK